MYQRRILVVENEPLLRDLIGQVLLARGFLVSTVGDVSTALRAVDQLDPDALVLDIDLGVGANGFDLADVLQRNQSTAAIVFLTNLPDPRFIGRDKGAIPKGSAYLSKAMLANSGHLVNALEGVLHETASVRYRHDLDSTRPLSYLSRSQIAVLGLVASGHTNYQIAALRGTTVRAVEGLISRTFEALNISVLGESNARVQAAAKYLRSVGWVAR